MTDDKLPDKVIPIDLLRITYDKKKKCKCYNRNFVVDSQNQEVLCGKCGAVVPAFEAIREMAQNYERLNGQVENLLAQRKKLEDWKPHLVALRELESVYRGNGLPCCPHCGRGIEAKELAKSTRINKEMELNRRRFEEKK